MKKEVGSSIYDAVKRLLDGDSSLWGTTWVADMSNGYVGIGYGELCERIVTSSLRARKEGRA